MIITRNSFWPILGRGKWHPRMLQYFLIAWITNTNLSTPSSLRDALFTYTFQGLLTFQHYHLHHHLYYYLHHYLLHHLLHHQLHHQLYHQLHHHLYYHLYHYLHDHHHLHHQLHHHLYNHLYHYLCNHHHNGYYNWRAVEPSSSLYWYTVWFMDGYS